jgi:hypothetical protein
MGVMKSVEHCRANAIKQKMSGSTSYIKTLQILDFMSSREQQFFNLRRLPARLRAEEVASFLGFNPQDIPFLVAGGLLKPLGNPPVTGVKYFSAVKIKELHDDVKWLSRASDCIVEYWRNVNKKKKAKKLATSTEAPILDLMPPKNCQ